MIIADGPTVVQEMEAARVARDRYWAAFRAQHKHVWSMLLANTAQFEAERLARAAARRGTGKPDYRKQQTRALWEGLEPPVGVAIAQRLWDRGQRVLAMRRAGLTYREIGKLIGRTPETARLTTRQIVAYAKRRGGLAPIQRWLEPPSPQEWRRAALTGRAVDGVWAT